MPTKGKRAKLGLCRNCHGKQRVVLEKTKNMEGLGLCRYCYEQSVVVTRDGKEIIAYTPQVYQVPFHESDATNLLALGTRNTGKSTQLRWDAIIRCLYFPNFKALIIRRKMPDLRKSHLQFIRAEADLLGATYRDNPNFDVHFENGSMIQFSHCESKGDITAYLSSEWDYIGFDELSTFPLDMFMMICASCRAPKTKPYKALKRACSNTLGIGSVWMKQWFIDKEVNREEYPDYFPTDFEMQYSSLEQNQYCDLVEYKRSLGNLPDTVRRSWLRGEFVVEGAYFPDFQREKEVAGVDTPWHCVQVMPTYRTRGGWDAEPLEVGTEWMSIYRTIDWGYDPDPWVCLWILQLPNRHEIVFKEMQGKRMVAADVAKAVSKASAGMQIVETFCDPTMFVKTGTVEYSIGEIFEQNGVPLTQGQNSRELFGYSIHDHLNTLVDGHPQLQIVEYACPNLVRTLPILQMDPGDPAKIAAGEDHWAVALAYYCMGKAAPTTEFERSELPMWMRPVPRRHRVIAHV